MSFYEGCLDAEAVLMKAEVQEHVDDLNLQMLHREKVKATGGQGRTVPAKEVNSSIGDEAAAWYTAAETELQAFKDKGCMHESTALERAAYRKRLPMLCVWTEKADQSKKCRACIMGNMEQLDTTAQDRAS